RKFGRTRRKYLTSQKTGLKYPEFANPFVGPNYELDPNSNHCETISPDTDKRVMEKTCRHTRVRVVARDDDAEFVECQDCGDVFEASEFKDMAIEDEMRPEEA